MGPKSALLKQVLESVKAYAVLYVAIVRLLGKLDLSWTRNKKKFPCGNAGIDQIRNAKVGHITDLIERIPV